MSDRCTPRFTELANSLGGIPCADANPIGYLNDPRHLADAMMPVIEVVMISGALLALAHAVSVLRRRGDATGLGIWLAAVVYVIVLEPPLYFPEAFGIAEKVPLVFVHNQFTIGFLYNRMPLYILLLYPAMVYLAWSIVARWRIGDRYSSRWATAAVTAVCVGFTHHVFYEIFDMLGPQRHWWAWDLEVATNGPRLASVPLSSMVNFALVMPTAFAFVAVLLFGRRSRTTARSVLLPAVGVGVLTPIVSAPGQLPATLLQAAPSVPDAVSVVLMVALLVGAALVTGREALRVPRGAVVASYPVNYAAAYLVVLAALWIAALPQTLDGGPLVGSLPYVVLCVVVSSLLLWVTAHASTDEAAVAKASDSPVEQMAP